MTYDDLQCEAFSVVHNACIYSGSSQLESRVDYWQVIAQKDLPLSFLPSPDVVTQAVINQLLEEPVSFVQLCCAVEILEQWLYSSLNAVYAPYVQPQFIKIVPMRDPS